MTNSATLLEKYYDIIAEEVNVKQVFLLEDTSPISIQYVPIGSTLWASFGKDTGRIIGSAKKGQAELKDGILIVSDGEDKWELNAEQYEIRYSWFDEPNQIVEDGAMIELDLELNDELIQEGIAREMSRFLNQMRKEADYQVSDRVSCGFVTSNDDYSGIIAKHEEYLMNEALLSSISRESLEGDITSSFELEGIVVEFSLKR